MVPAAGVSYENDRFFCSTMVESLADLMNSTPFILHSKCQHTDRRSCKTIPNENIKAVTDTASDFSTASFYGQMIEPSNLVQL